MSEVLRKGWCPGALRPMMARDGLLVRLRLSGGRLVADQARALAALAAFYGNGLFDLSARANLQMRGVAAEHLSSLLDALADLDMLDTDPAGEAVRNVMVSPLAGPEQPFDIAPVAKDLEERLVRDTALHALPGKFGFIIDDGSKPSLAGETADIRFDLVDHDEPRVWIGLGGTRDNAVSMGFCAPDEIVEAAAYLARTFLSLAAAHDPPLRRMKRLIERLGAYQSARAFGAFADNGRPEYAGAIFQRVPVGLFHEASRDVLGLAAPFGRLDHTMLRAAADLAEAHGGGDLRLTPWRCILVPGLTSSPDLEACRALGFIVDPLDPLLRIAACVGMEGCVQGTTPTHADAAYLADAAARLGGASVAIHVSGCEKGCAKATRTAFTLVGQGGRYDLVSGGKAGDVPVKRDLDVFAAHDAIVATKIAS